MVLADAFIPYISVGPIAFFGLKIYVFAVLLWTAVLLGFAIAVRRGRRFGIGREELALLSLCMVTGGYVAADLARILYDPFLMRELGTHPWEVLLRFHGIASFGAYFGGLAAAWVCFAVRRERLERRLAYLDCIGFALPFAWCVGRIGCALVHDHPGVRSSSWLAVRYPGGSRMDLGLLEALFLMALGAIWLWLDRRRRPAGFYFGLYFALYGPFRVLLDNLHVDAPQYFGVTVDHWAGWLATVVGFVVLSLSFRTGRVCTFTPHDELIGISKA